MLFTSRQHFRNGMLLPAQAFRRITCSPQHPRNGMLFFYPSPGVSVLKDQPAKLFRVYNSGSYFFLNAFGNRTFI